MLSVDFSARIITPMPNTDFVVPCLNAEQTIGRCIEGIRSCGDNLRLTVVDNGSTDQSVQVARSYGSDLIRAPLETVGGVRNAGARQGRADFIAFVDADCVLPADWLKNGLRYFSDDGVAMVGAYHYVPSEKSNWVEDTWSFHMRSLNRRGATSWLPTRALLVRRKAFEEFGGFDPNLVSCEDADLGYRLSAAHKIIAAPNWPLFTLEARRA